MVSFCSLFNEAIIVYTFLFTPTVHPVGNLKIVKMGTLHNLLR
jgi:hypothetical protein